MLEEYADERSMLDATARDIAADKIVALCNGRMEFGARALGNRSLLALPSKAANKDRINLAIKKRQNYRPFAPAVACGGCASLFRSECRRRISLHDHVDPCARGGTATSAGDYARGRHRARANGQPALQCSFYYLLSRLKELTGVPVVLNTSYNVNHQPIVCDEAEAVDTFVEMGIDALFIANAKVTRRAIGRPASAAHRHTVRRSNAEIKVSMDDG